ncbi:hypothetical protein CC86DRAFT_353094 [Ophiobolus disseminans]|uniref:BZIP domain-containing protein n=1 Tax=Ophiobolus disseminans TaxID=1469910 RepID=A0A6A6ZUA1_9PLEO|nr:hypothetical protein CC86DRAFT_353094 [Ophiobolus disseminans]
MSHSQGLVQRQRAPQLTHVTNNDDDWTGISDAAARRKRQNRLNVRAYRKRKAGASHVEVLPPAPHWNGAQQSIVLRTPTSSSTGTPLLPRDVPTCHSISTVTFPLSSDHLITLVQFNVLRGSVTNRQLLDKLPCLDSQVYNTFHPTDLHYFPVLCASDLQGLPPALHPTTLQCTILHPHWIDMFPHPRARDNLITATGHYDPHDLWIDVIGGLFQGFTKNEVSGFLVWSTPWHWEGWEMSEAFIDKWGWMLEGCEDLLEATNKWRAGRNEGKIAIHKASL